MLAAVVAVGSVLLVVSFFVADSRLDPPFDQAELPPIEIPTGEPLAEGTLLSASDTTGNFEIYSQPIVNGGPVRLTSDPNFDSFRPRLSPDRRTVMFYRAPFGVGDSDLTQAALWMVGAQGGVPVEVLPPRSHGWTMQGHAEWSPTGDQLVMTGGRPQALQVWLTTSDGRSARVLTDQVGDFVDPSWSPDGKRLLYSACPEHPCLVTDREIFAALATGEGERVQITNDDFADEGPRFSPDGTKIAMRTQIVPPGEDGTGAVWDIRVVPTNRTEPPVRLVGDASVSAAPTWLDDRTVLFHRFDEAGLDADIYMAQISGATLVPLVLGPANDLYPAAS